MSFFFFLFFFFCVCSLACLNVAFSVVVTTFLFLFFLFFLVASICWKSFFFVYLVVRFFFFFFSKYVTWGKNMSREVTYRSSSIFLRSSVSFFGFSGIPGSRVGVLVR